MSNRRRALRDRLADYAEFAASNGTIRRVDMMRIGEISDTQASSDMKALIEDYPQLGIVYDTRQKTYVVTAKRRAS